MLFRSPGVLTNGTKGLELPPASLSDADFVAFDTANHTFTLTPEAAKRLSAKLWELWTHGGPFKGPFIYRTGDYTLIPGHAEFVLLASGEPLYCGVFCPGLVCSDGHIDGVPTITAQSNFISTNLTTNVAFSIQRALPLTPQTAADAAPRLFSRPVTLDGEGRKLDDVLDDPRLIAAVRKLFPRERR